MRLLSFQNVAFIAVVAVATHFILQPVYRLIDQNTGAN